MKTLAIVVLAPLLALAQSKPAGAGHWEGAIKTPQMDVKIAVDLVQNAKAEWIGSMDVEPQNAKGVPLSNITVKGSKISFKIAGMGENAPSFDGELAPDGKSIKGDTGGPQGSAPFELKWVSEPKVVTPKKEAPIAKEFEGAWDGSIETPDGKTLRTRVKLSNADGQGKGTFNSLDQNNVDMPISDIVTGNKKLSFALKIAGGSYEGALNDPGDEIKGTWTQGMFTAPLVLKKQKP